MAYVPQEPIVFHGQSLRLNLDPSGKLLDTAIWPVLQSLRISIGSLDNLVTPEMPTSIMELICLARALLCDCPILLMDEPMASLDYSALTTVLADPSFSARLADRTVIMVTHRPELIDFCDTVMRLSEGQLVP
jgi:ABC-type multidrug transport system fused ATPase/permease subunit